MVYLCTRNRKGCKVFKVSIAEIAQLVEHNLAKVGVASSSLVFRSKRRSSPNGLLFSSCTVGNDGLHEATPSRLRVQKFLGQNQAQNR